MYAKKGPGELQHTGTEADSFEELADKALADIEDLSDLGTVCGPITTGGTDNQELNFQVLSATVNGLKRRGIALFDLRPYEFGIGRLRMKWEAAGGIGYCLAILEVFYRKVFESGKIRRAFFIPGWWSSLGACWERKMMKLLGNEVIDLTHAQIREFLNEDGHSPAHVEHIMSLIGCETADVTHEQVRTLLEKYKRSPEHIEEVLELLAA